MLCVLRSWSGLLQFCHPEAAGGLTALVAGLYLPRLEVRETDAPLLNLNDSCHKAWASRIMNYLKPSSNKYSHTDLSTTCNGHSATRAGCHLIRHLLRHN
ncbi:unnamed protein product, partial [Leptidea sinapis]